MIVIRRYQSRTSRIPGFLLLCFTTTLGSHVCASGTLRLEVVRGESANNNASLGTAVAAAVRVIDDNGAPLKDALVIFSSPKKGPGVIFSGSRAEAGTVTDDSGIAVAPAGRATGGDGPFEISVVASHGGELATCLIHQINLGARDQVVRQEELDVVNLSIPQSRGGVSTFRVRVLDGRNNPVPRATVLFVVQRTAHGNRVAELVRVSAVTDQNGEATVPDFKQVGRKNVQVKVVAEQRGHRATRYFDFE